MPNHDGKKRIVIGDNGIAEKQDKFSLVVIIITTILVFLMFYLGIMVYIG